MKYKRRKFLRKFSVDHLQDLREDRSLEELAVMAGKSVSTVRNWFAGRTVPNADELVALADGLGVKVDALFEEED